MKALKRVLLLTALFWPGLAFAQTTPIFNFADTWNNAGTTFIGIGMNVTDTGHAAASRLIRLQVGAATKFDVDINGAITGLNFTAAAQGLTPLSGGGTTNFLRADGTWTAPPGGSLTINTSTITGGTTGNFLYNNAGTVGERTPTQATAALNQFTTTLQGLVPGSGGGTANFLRADGTWTAPSAAAGVPLTGNGATIVVSTPLIDVSQTWNAGGVTFTGVRSNITNTASAAGSPLLDLQVGGTPTFTVYRTPPGGTVLAAITSALVAIPNNAQMYFGGGGIFALGNSELTFTAANNVNDMQLSTVGLALQSAISYGWSGTSDARAAKDALLFRDAAATIAQRNSTNAQTFRVYNTFTDASNYERGVIDWTTTANTLSIGTQNAGTGTQRNLKFIIGGTNVMDFGISSSLVWTSAFPFIVAGTASLSAPNVTVTSAGAVNWGSSGLSSPDVGLSRTAPNVVRMGDGGANANGWMQWAGQTRVTADVTYTSTTTPAIVTGLSAALQAARTYSFDVQLSFTDAAAGGIQCQMAGAGGLTATNIIYDGWITDSGANGIKGNAQATALAGVVANATTTGTAGHVTLKGTITVNVAGNLQVFCAQSASSGTATTVKRGSYMLVYDMP